MTPDDIAAVFGTVLDDVDDVGVDDDFFEIGGSSFTALTLVARLNAAAKTTLRLRDVIRVPTPRGLAYVIESRAADPAAGGGAR
jgi:hypothetical protein